MEDDLGDRVAVRYTEKPCDPVGPESGVQRNGTLKEFGGVVRAGFRTNLRKDGRAIRNPIGLRISEHVASDNKVIRPNCHLRRLAARRQDVPRK
jgi:hypothetical protein